MNYLKTLLILGLILICACTQENNLSARLNKIIKSYQDHKGYDEKEYPLGLFTEEYYASEAEFAKTKLEDLSKIDIEKLDESDKISTELLTFVLENKVNSFKFEMYLNPLLSDAGFHNNLTYLLSPLNNYKQVKNYLNKLNALPEFVNQHFKNLRKGLEKVSHPPFFLVKD